MTPTTPASGAADLLTLIEAYAEARHCKGHSSYNAQTATALQAVKDALAAGQATAAQPVAEQTKSADMSDEREAFEAWLRSIWSAGYGCPKFDSGKYVHHEAQRFWECWQASASHGQAPADAAPSAGAVAGPDDIDAIALTRYKVVHSHDSMFHRFAVVAGDGKQQLYLGRETECQNMTRKFAGAFLDGAFYQSQIAAAPTPAAPAADSVLYDPKAVLEIFNSARAGSEKPVGYLRGILAVIAHWESRQEPHRWMVPAQAGAVPLDDARRLFDAGWKAAAMLCDREDVVADGIIGFGACPQFEAAFSAAHGIKGGQHGTDT